MSERIKVTRINIHTFLQFTRVNLHGVNGAKSASSHTFTQCNPRTSSIPLFSLTHIERVGGGGGGGGGEG